MVAMIQTVAGPVSADELGFTLVHEHVVCASPGILQAWPALYGGREALIERAVTVLTDARAAGVDTIVDATPFDLGRDIGLLAEVSARSGMRIIAASGHWLVPSPTMAGRSTPQLTQFFISELTQGADGTNLRAGIVKVASEEAIEPFDRRVLEAAAAAHKETGAAILTHAAARNRIGELQAAVFEEVGVAPDRVVIGHSDDTTDISYITGLADRGYYIGMDRIPCGALPEYGTQSIAARLQMIAELVATGYANRLMLSHDDPIWAGLLSDEDQRRHVQSNPDVIAFIPRVALPELRRLGVSEGAIRQMTVDNPRAWLGGV
jgi:phosphotriesterase-related protein